MFSSVCPAASEMNDGLVLIRIVGARDAGHREGAIANRHGLALGVEAFAEQLGRRRLPQHRHIVPGRELAFEERPAVDVGQ